ncbi:MAG: hypothetical protein U9N46_01815 [Euryarchaeota archaeon]|nr:hypothetical protein [Euryarchaeota archaeon]
MSKLLKKDEADGALAWTLTWYYDKAPAGVRDLLFELSRKDVATWAVAWAVAANFDSLPKDVRNLLDRLQNPLQQVIEKLSISEERMDKEDASHLISNALSKINPDFALKILNKLCKSGDERVQTEAVKLLSEIAEGEDKKNKPISNSRTNSQSPNIGE